MKIEINDKRLNDDIFRQKFYKIRNQVRDNINRYLPTRKNMVKLFEHKEINEK